LVVRLVALGTCTITANQAGNSSYAAAPDASQTFDVVKGDQSISITSSPPSPAFVGASYTVAATGGASGNPIVFTTADAAACPVIGSMVTFASTGTCQILADQAGNENYNAAPQATQVFPIVKRPQSIVFTSAPPNPGLLAGSYSLAATGGGSGNAVTFSTLTPATCTVAGSAVTFVGVGACSLAADQPGSSAYLAAPRQTQQVRVIYSFSGFFQPVDNLPVVNTTNAGKGISIEFDLAGDQGLDILQSDSPTSGSYACTASPEDVIEVTLALTKSSLSYKAPTGRYQYLWRTEKTWVNTCRKLVITLKDGTVHQALFHFVK
jgi:hypothetical protein